MRSKRFFGMLAVFWGVFFLLPMLFGGMRMRAYSHAQFAESRSEAAGAASAAQVDGDESVNSAETNRHTHRHRHGHHGFGPFGFIGGIFKLFFIGFMFMALMKMFRRRRYWHRRHHARKGEKSPDDLTEDIRVGDEINRAEAASEAPDMPSPEEMTVDDLVMAMKRLGIKKLEL